MAITSAAPEGRSGSCPICSDRGQVSRNAPEAALCARCEGHWRELRTQIPALPVRLKAGELAQPLADFVESLEFLELMLAWEERYPDLASLLTANQVRTVADVLRWLAEHDSQGS